MNRSKQSRARRLTIAALRDAGARVADTPWQLAEELVRAGYGIRENG